MAKKLKAQKETKIDKELKRHIPFLAWLAILAVLFFIFYFAFQNLGKVKYEGLTFVKEKYGEVLVYHYNYLTKVSSGNYRSIDVFVRGNPAENMVPINKEIIYPKDKTVYLSVNQTGLRECEDSTIALASLSIFLTNNDIPLKTGTPDWNEAKEKNQTYIDCGHYPLSMTLLLRTGEETRINRNGLCYYIDVADCEILPAIEKFIVQSIIDAKGDN